MIPGRELVWEWKPKTRVRGGPLWVCERVVVSVEGQVLALRLGEKKPEWAVEAPAGELAAVGETIVLTPVRAAPRAFSGADGAPAKLPTLVESSVDAVVSYAPRRMVECKEADTGEVRWCVEHRLGLGYDTRPVIDGNVAYCFGQARSGSVKGFAMADGELVYEAGKGFIVFVQVHEELMLTRTERGAVRVYGPSTLRPPPKTKPKSRPTSALDKLLAAKPNERAFARLAKALDELGGSALANAIDTAAPVLAAWPDEVRRAPARWIERVLSGEDEPRAALARVLGKQRLRPTTTVAGARAFMALELRRERIDLEDRQLPPAALEVLLNTREIRALFLTRTQVGPAGAAIIARCAASHDLEALSLTDAGIDADAAAALACGSFVALKGLTLDRNPCGDTGARALATSAAFPALEDLDLSRCKIGDRGCEAIADAPWRLSWLELANNPFGADGASALSGARCLGDRQQCIFREMVDELAGES